jgi:hypothetical protein
MPGMKQREQSPMWLNRNDVILQRSWLMWETARVSVAISTEAAESSTHRLASPSHVIAERESRVVGTTLEEKVHEMYDYHAVTTTLAYQTIPDPWATIGWARFTSTDARSGRERVRWMSVVVLSVSVGISTRTADGFSNLLERPQKNCEFSYIARYLHFSVLALRMH